MGSSEVQGKLWGAAAEDWVDIERFGIPFYEAVFDAVELGAGVRLLDLGCGAGLAMTMAAQRGATVAGIDAAEGLLEVARRRLPDADLRRGDLEELPYADDSYELVTCFNSVQFAADPLAALREARRVAVPGGKVAIVTWGDPERCETRVVLAAVAALLPPQPPGGWGPFALSAPGRLEELASAAGLATQQAGEVAAAFTFPDLDEAVRIQMSAGPLQRAIEHAGEAATRQALIDAFAGARQDDGSYRHENVFRYVIAGT